MVSSSDSRCPQRINHIHQFRNTATFKKCEDVIIERLWLEYLLPHYPTGSPKEGYSIGEYSREGYSVKGYSEEGYSTGVYSIGVSLLEIILWEVWQ